MLDSARTQIVQEAVPFQRSSAILQRLKKSRNSRRLSQSELRKLLGVAEFIAITGFTYGFLYPTVLKINREHANKVGLSLVELVLRGISRKRQSPV